MTKTKNLTNVEDDILKVVGNKLDEGKINENYIDQGFSFVVEAPKAKFIITKSTNKNDIITSINLGECEDKLRLNKTISEFLFYDTYNFWASYSRFELCFQPLFNNIKIDLFKVFIEIVGELKKYITYKRLVQAYLKRTKKLKIILILIYIYFSKIYLQKF